MRKLFFWLHLCAGVIAGLIIFIMSVTGVLLMYEKQLIAWADQRSLPPLQTGSRLPVEDLLARAQTQRGSLPVSIALPSDQALPAQLAYGREIAYQDPASGQLLGPGNTSVRKFFRSVTDWHRWLAASENSRSTGRAATGAANLAFLFIVLSGAYLWLPRVWTRASVRAIAWFRGGLSGKARDFNWHNAIGVWCLVPLVLIVASGSVISYPWASNLVYTLTGTQAPSGPGGPRREGPRREGQPAAADVAGLNALWQQAASHASGWRLLTLRVPDSNRAPVSFQIDQGYAGQPQQRITLALDRSSGAVKSREAFADLNQGRRLRTWLRFVHTGEFYGLTGQTIAGIASLGAAVLTYTGIALSLRRFAAWRRRRSRDTAAEALPVSTVQ